MLRYLLIFFSVSVLLVSCASKTKVLKEIDKDAPHNGHLYKLDNYVIEVAEVPTKVMKFYFYTLDGANNLVPAPLKNIHLKNGVVDPESTKQNFSILFIERKTYIEGILEKYEIDDKDNHEIMVDVKIGDKKRKIAIPVEHEE